MIFLFVFIVNQQYQLSLQLIVKQRPIIMLTNQAIKYFHKSALLATFLLMKRVSTSKMEAYPIEEYEVGERLDRYLKKTPLGWVSGQKLLRKGDIIVKKADGTFIDQGCYRFQQNDMLMVSHVIKDKIGKNELKQDRLIPRDEATRILQKMLIFDNQNIAILNKLPGYSVQGGPNPRMNIFSLMSSKYKKQMIYITHRLDRVTSGLVLVAKNKQCAQLVQISMEEKTTFGKYYLALSSSNKPITNTGYIRSNIEWTSKNKARLCNQSEQNSKDCVTFYTSIQSIKLQSTSQQKLNQSSNNQIYNNLLGIKLLTGRKHQIRCHLSSYLQQPILNDALYGGARMPQFKEDDAAVYLHAFGLMIKNREIIDKVKSGNRYLVNNKLGQMTLTDNSLLFTANLPEYWKNKINLDINLPELTKKIERLEKDSQQNAPKKRNITKIT